MNASMLPESSRPPRLALLKIMQPETMFAPVGGHAKAYGLMFGHVWLGLTEIYDRPLRVDTVEVLGLSLAGPGVFEGPRFTRRFSVTGRGSNAVEFRHGKIETVDLSIWAEYLDDRAVVSRAPYRLDEGAHGIYETPRDIYRGTLTITIQRSDQGYETQPPTISGRLVFDLERGVSLADPPRIQQLVAELPTVPTTFFPGNVAGFGLNLDEAQAQSEQDPGDLLFLASTAPAGSSSGSTGKPRGTLSLKPVYFKRAESETGRSKPSQCANATDLWAGSCIDIQILAEEVIDAAQLQPDQAERIDSVDPTVIAGLWRNPDPFTVTVFFVPGVLADCGGAATLNAATNIPTIVMTDLDPADPDHNNLNLLAHELGHALLSLHPVGASIKGYWKPDRNTVMEATNDSTVPNPGNNTARNRRLASGPVVVPDGTSCTPS